MYTIYICPAEVEVFYIMGVFFKGHTVAILVTVLVEAILSYCLQIQQS